MKKIMFNDKCGLTEAVLKGNKTMTRRVVCLPEYWHGMWVWSFAFDKQSCSLRLYDADEFPMEDPDTGECAYVNPHYKIGEVVAVAQSYKDLGYSPTTIQRGRCIRKSTHGDNPGWSDDMIGQIGDWYIDQLAGWNNKMFVHPSMCNHQIRITDVKVEMLQDISEEDCVKEGISEMRTGYGYKYKGKYCIAYCQFPHIKDAFADLLDEVSGKDLWKLNPYVFAYTFELVK